jgi:hypothetical protein
MSRAHERDRAVRPQRRAERVQLAMLREQLLGERQERIEHVFSFVLGRPRWH